MSSIVIDETFTSNSKFVKMRMVANNQSIVLKANARSDGRFTNPTASVYLTDQEVDDLIVLLTYYKTNKISQGFTWKEADE